MVQSMVARPAPGPSRAPLVASVGSPGGDGGVPGLMPALVLMAAIAAAGGVTGSRPPPASTVPTNQPPPPGGTDEFRDPVRTAPRGRDPIAVRGAARRAPRSGLLDDRRGAGRAERSPVAGRARGDSPKKLANLKTQCPVSNGINFGTWCLEAAPHSIPAEDVGTNDYFYATQTCAREGGWLPTAAQLIGAAPKAALQSTIDDNPATSGAEEFPDPTRGIKDKREMSADLFTVTAGSEAAGSEGVTAGSRGNASRGTGPDADAGEPRSRKRSTTSPSTTTTTWAASPAASRSASRRTSAAPTRSAPRANRRPSKAADGRARAADLTAPRRGGAHRRRDCRGRVPEPPAGPLDRRRRRLHRRHPGAASRPTPPGSPTCGSSPPLPATPATTATGSPPPRRTGPGTSACDRWTHASSATSASSTGTS